MNKWKNSSATPLLPSSLLGGKSALLFSARCPVCLLPLALTLILFARLCSSCSSTRIGCFILSPLIPCGMSCCSCLLRFMFRLLKPTAGICRKLSRFRTSRTASTSNCPADWSSSRACLRCRCPRSLRSGNLWLPRIFPSWWTGPRSNWKSVKWKNSFELLFPIQSPWRLRSLSFSSNRPF